MIKPTGSNVVIKPTEEKLSDTILVAELNRAPSCYGTVLAIGPKVMDLVIGDKVFCGRYEGIKHGSLENEVRIVPLESVLARFGS